MGPNGTGKSTLVSAILVGMGGNFQKIGRATTLKDYIKHGKDRASIEITLYKNEDRQTITFCRKIKANGKSEYLLNNRSVDEQRYMASVRRFNIQVDNLCQFLPQDRVQDFALMNPHEILVNTQSSVLPPNVSQQFEKLLEFENSSKGVVDKTASLEKQIASEEATNERLKPVVERMQQRNAITDRLKVANMKQKWLKKVELETELQGNQRDIDMAKNTITDRARALLPLQESATRVLKNRAMDQKVIDENKRKVDMAKVELRQLQNQAEPTETQMEEAANEFNVKVTEIENRTEQQRTLERSRGTSEKELNLLEREFQLAEKAVNVKARITEMEQTATKRDELLERRNELGYKIDEQLKPKVIAMENRIKSMRSLGEQRLGSLRALNENLYKAVLWLRENRNSGLFSGHVYEPMLLELNVKREHIQYFENTISKNDLMAFTCENTTDTVVLHKKLNELGLRVNVLHSPAADEVDSEPPQDLRSMQQYGIHSYLLQLVEGPVPILNYLCKMYGIHKIPVGSEGATRNISALDFPVVFLGNKRLFTKRSLYMNESIRGTSHISPRNWLTVGVDEALVLEQEQQLRELRRNLDVLRNKRSEIESEIEYMDGKLREWKTAQNQLSAMMNKMKAKKTQLNSLVAKISHLESLPNSIDTEEVAHKKFQATAMKKLLENSEQQAVKLTAIMESLHGLRVMQKKLIFRDRESTDLKRELEAAKTRLDEAKRLYETIQRSLTDLKEQIRSFKSQFEQLAQVESPVARSFAHRVTFNELPDAMEALQEQMVLMRTQIDCMNQDDESLYHQYENRCKLLIELKDALVEQRDRRSNVSRDIERLRSQWLPVVQDMVQEVNKNFKRFMRLINVVGEVELISNTENRFSEFGIGIRVQYHDNGPFLILDRYHHSGGERAVAIATYTLALQKISQVPFRCVDEINQGMDPDNERKVFNMLVDEAAQPGRAQYFFVSPKYQPDVKVNRYVTFHIIDSGKYLEHDVFNSSSGMLVE